MAAENSGGSSVDYIVLAYNLMDRLPRLDVDGPVEQSSIMDPFEGWEYAYDRLAVAVGGLLTDERATLQAMRNEGMMPAPASDSDARAGRSREEQRRRIVGRALFELDFKDWPAVESWMAAEDQRHPPPLAAPEAVESISEPGVTPLELHYSRLSSDRLFVTLVVDGREKPVTLSSKYKLAHVRFLATASVIKQNRVRPNQPIPMREVFETAGMPHLYSSMNVLAVTRLWRERLLWDGEPLILLDRRSQRRLDASVNPRFDLRAVKLDP